MVALDHERTTNAAPLMMSPPLRAHTQRLYQTSLEEPGGRDPRSLEQVAVITGRLGRRSRSLVMAAAMKPSCLEWTANIGLEGPLSDRLCDDGCGRGLCRGAIAPEPGQAPLVRRGWTASRSVKYRQGVIPKRVAHAEATSGARTDQRLDRVKGALAQQVPREQTPQQRRRGNGRGAPAIAGGLQIRAHLAVHERPQATDHRGRRLAGRRCRRASASNWALAASTSRTASWKARPASTCCCT